MKYTYFVYRLLACITLLLSGENIAWAQASFFSSSGSLPIPGVAEGVASTAFAVRESEYLDVVVTTDAPVSGRVLSIQGLVELRISEAEQSTTTFTIEGLEPKREYHLYTDTYTNYTPFTSNAEGEHTLEINTQNHHTLFIQEKKSTLYIRDDITGGDCATVGEWNHTTKTCILTQDVHETIEIFNQWLGENMGITLDGGGYSIVGAHTGIGVRVYNSQKVKIQNVTIKNFSVGLMLTGGYDNRVENTNIQDSRIGISISHEQRPSILNSNIDNAPFRVLETYEVHDMLLQNSNGTNVGELNIGQNTRFPIIDSAAFSGENAGIFLDRTEHATIKATSVDGPMRSFGYMDGRPTGIYFRLDGWDDADFAHTIDDSNSFGDKSLMYRKDIEGETIDVSDAFVFICAFCKSVEIANGDLSNTFTGMYLYDTNDSVIRHNSFRENTLGLLLIKSQRNTIRDNTFRHNYHSLALAPSQRNTGFSVVPDVPSSGNTIYHNNFTGRATNSADIGDYGSGSFFSRPLPLGGNYWDEYDALLEGCEDVDANHLCDAPRILHNIYGGMIEDVFPWTEPSAWDATTTGTSTTEECCNSIMFLPGFGASRLYRPNGSEDKQLWEPHGDDKAQELAMTPAGVSIRNDIFTTDVIDNAYFPVKGNVYKSFLEHLEYMKSEEHIIADYTVVPYDWRLQLDEILNNGAKTGDKISYLTPTSSPYIIEELRRLAAGSDTGKVTIIAHSNGGLLAKALITKLGEEAPGLVDQMIFVGVPQAGTPTAIGALLHGFNQGMPHSAIPNGMTPQTARSLALNIPGAYNLLPSANYFTYVDDPAVTFSDDAIIAPFKNKFGSVIHSSELLRSFLTDASRSGSASFSNLLYPSVANSILFDQAEDVHDLLDVWQIPDGIALTEIAGWGILTPATIEYKEGYIACRTPNQFSTCPTAKVPVVLYEPKFTLDGDGTVVVPSALWTTAANKYWLDLQNYNDDNPVRAPLGRQHADIFEVPELFEFIHSLITTSTSTLPQYIFTAKPVNEDLGTHLHFLLHSPLSLHLFDINGNHTGISTTTGEVMAEIPGSYYNEFGEVKFISIPASTSAQVILEGYESGSFTFTMQEIKDDHIVASTTFAAIPSSTSTIVTMSISGDGGIAGLEDMEVDYNGDGSPELVLSPPLNGTVFPPQVDTFPPQTNASTTGMRGTNGWYISDVSIWLFGEDNENGSGIASTSYSLDLGNTWQQYLSPFSIIQEGSSTILYRSSDQAGNLEPIQSVTLNIDKSAPEAQVFIDPAAKDITVVGIDTSSTTVSKEGTIYTITDQAGHRTQVAFTKTYTGKYLTAAKLMSIQYNMQPPVLTPKTAFAYVWDTRSSPHTLLSQTIFVDSTYTVEALYDKRKNKTTVIVFKKLIPIQKKDFGGLRIIKLMTKNSNLEYQF